MLKNITINPKVNLGKPTITGTRITVEHILLLLWEGMTIDTILEEYPWLTKKDIYNTLLFSARYIHNEELQEYA